MGTFKHIGRLRTARLIGRELASFYLYVQHFVSSIAHYVGKKNYNYVIITYFQVHW